MIDNKDMPAFPQSVSANEVGIYLATSANIEDNAQVTGLTKRELIAAHIDCSKDIDDYPIAFFKELLGRDMPDNQIEKYKYFAEAEAKLRVIKADALLSELSKTQP